MKYKTADLLLSVCKSAVLYSLRFIGFCLGGVSEIRTRDTLLAYTRFPGVPLQPLEHHSSFLRLQR